jgi:uncharacterized OB-fold protein
MTIPPSSRAVPRLAHDTAFFWTSGSDGRLRLLQCRVCQHLIHPPAPICRHCRGTDVVIAALSGQGTLWSFTVVHQPFVEWMKPPFVVGVVEIIEDPATRLTTNIVGCRPEEVRIGMGLRVRFEQHGEIFLPLFVPAESGCAP